MDAVSLIRDQIAAAHDQMIRVMSPVTPDQAAWKLPGATTNTIGATFLHAYSTEDGLLHRMTGAPTVFDAGNWRGRLGYDPEASWTLEGRSDPALLVEYAQAVAAATAEYLSKLTPDALDQQVETRQGPRPLGFRLTTILAGHKLTHMGEIAALLGCQGVKGLPF